MTKNETPHEIAFDLEDDVRAVEDMGVLVARFAESLDSKDGSALGRLGWLIIERARRIGEQREKLCHMVNPRKELARPPIMLRSRS